MFSNFDSEHLRTSGASADLSAFRMQTVESGTAPQMPWAVILRIQTSLVHLPHHGTNCPMGSQWAHILTKTDRDLNVLSLVEDWQSSNNSKPRNSSAFLSGCRSRDFVRKAWRKERACLGGKMGQAAPIKIKILQRSAKCQGHPRTTSSKVTSAYTGDWCPLLKNSIYLQLHGILICLRATGPKTDLDDFLDERLWPGRMKDLNDPMSVWEFVCANVSTQTAHLWWTKSVSISSVQQVSASTPRTA